jgi:hypothetical protein
MSHTQPGCCVRQLRMTFEIMPIDYRSFKQAGAITVFLGCQHLSITNVQTRASVPDSSVGWKGKVCDLLLASGRFKSHRRNDCERIKQSYLVKHLFWWHNIDWPVTADSQSSACSLHRHRLHKCVKPNLHNPARPHAVARNKAHDQFLSCLSLPSLLLWHLNLANNGF